MVLKRKEKPLWFALVDKLRALREMNLATYTEMAAALKVSNKRITEWTQGTREVKGQKTLEVQQYIFKLEEDLRPEERAQYARILARLKRSS